MLKKIYIRNIVLIKEIEIDLYDGLHVFSGETGAGKSILLEGLGLALGARANFSLIGNYSNDAEIRAIFKINQDNPIFETLKKLNIDFKNELSLKRIINNNGTSKAYLNNTQISLSELSRVGLSLVEVQGQFDNHTLLNSQNHVNFLDQFIGYDEIAKKTEVYFKEMIKSRKDFNEFKNEFDNYEKNIEFKENILLDFKKINPKVNESTELEERRSLIAESSKLTNMLIEVQNKVNGENSISKLLNFTLNLLEKSNSQNNSLLSEIIDTLSRASNEVNEAEEQISSLINSINADPNELEYIDNRLFELKKLSRKVECETNNLNLFHSNLIEELSKVENKETLLKEKERTFNKKLEEFKLECLELRKLRIKNALMIDKSINDELPFLKLEQAQFKTFIKEKNEVDWNENGSDEVIFHIVTNPQQQFMPLGKIISGGELSRFLLAIKVVLADTSRSSTLVFDEVDSGIGGQTADAVGTRLLSLSKKNQVIVITHSPQVSAKGEHHYLIQKLNDEDKSLTLCKKIMHEKRIEEISRMLSGERISNEARAAAKQLINE